MKALHKIYHVECFKCDECGDRLEKGDEFILKEDKLYCSADFNVAEQRSDSKYLLLNRILHSLKQLTHSYLVVPIIC